MSVVLILAGLFLMVFKIVEDSEPGAIPLLFISIGTGWFLLIKYRIRSHSINI